jgi:hypothetical protein
MTGFFQAMQSLAPHNDLALKVLLKLSQNKLCELFLCHLPRLFSTRHDYIQFLDSGRERLISALNQIEDEAALPLKVKFQSIGLPNFMISQCISLFPSQTHQPIAVSLLLRTWAAFPGCLAKTKFDYS